MSEQTNKAQVDDLAKKRRRYVLDTTMNNVLAMTGFLAAAGLGILSIILLPVVLLSFIWGFPEGIFFGIAAVLIAGSLACRSFTAAKKMPIPPYVPPVAEQIAALRASEVLLRGAGEPTATSEVLLRAAASASVEPAEELLRAEQGRPI